MMKEINELLEKTIKGAVIGSLAGIKDDLLSKLVDIILNTKVNRDGSEKIEHGQEEMAYLDFLFNQQIKDLIREAVKEYIKENREALKTRVRAKLSEAGGFIDKVANKIETNLDSSWGLSINLRDDNY